MLRKIEVKCFYIPDDIIQDDRLNSDDRLVHSIVLYHDHSARGCFASTKYLAKKLNFTERKMQRIIQKLTTLGLFQLEYDKVEPKNRLIKVVGYLNTSKKIFSVGVKTDAGGVKTDAGGVKTDAGGVKTDAIINSNNKLINKNKEGVENFDFEKDREEKISTLISMIHLADPGTWQNECENLGITLDEFNAQLSAWAKEHAFDVWNDNLHVIRSFKLHLRTKEKPRGQATQTTGRMPAYYDHNFERHLNGQQSMEYHRHLIRLGWKKIIAPGGTNWQPPQKTKHYG